MFANRWRKQPGKDGPKRLSNRVSPLISRGDDETTIQANLGAVELTNDYRRVRQSLSERVQSDGAFPGVARSLVRRRARHRAGGLGERMGTPGAAARSQSGPYLDE